MQPACRERDRERQSVHRSSAPSRWETETCCIGSVWEQTAADRSAVIVTQIIVRRAELREATSPKRCPRSIATHVLVIRGGERRMKSSSLLAVSHVLLSRWDVCCKLFLTVLRF